MADTSNPPTAQELAKALDLLETHTRDLVYSTPIGAPVRAAHRAARDLLRLVPLNWFRE